MVAVLEKPPTECTCPSNEELDDAKFWTVTGTGPKEVRTYLQQKKPKPPLKTFQEQVNKSFNTLLPEIPNENQQKALTDIITNIVANNFGSTSSLSSKTTPTTSLWEIDPPIDKSSPLPSWNVKGHLQKAKSLLDEALNLLTDDDTYTKTSVKKRISDIKPTTPVQKGMNGDGRNPKGSTVKKGMIPVLNSVERKKVGEEILWGF